MPAVTELLLVMLFATNAPALCMLVLLVMLSNTAAPVLLIVAVVMLLLLTRLFTVANPPATKLVVTNVLLATMF